MYINKYLNIYVHKIKTSIKEHCEKKKHSTFLWEDNKCMWFGINLCKRYGKI